MYVAHINVVRFKLPPDHPGMGTFIANVARINALAEASPGFVWRYVEATGEGPEFVEFADGSVLGALSVWTTAGALRSFVYGEHHSAIMRRRGEWMSPTGEVSHALWRVAEGERPSLHEAWRRLTHRRGRGDSEYAFGFRRCDATLFGAAAAAPSTRKKVAPTDGGPSRECEDTAQTDGVLPSEGFGQCNRSDDGHAGRP